MNHAVTKRGLHTNVRLTFAELLEQCEIVLNLAIFVLLRGSEVQVMADNDLLRRYFIEGLELV